MENPYFIKHRQELRPRRIERIADGKLKARKLALKDQDLVAVPTTETALKFLSTMGDPLASQIQSLEDVE